MSTDEWSIDAEGKYNSNTTVYSPVVSSYIFCAIQMEFHFIGFFIELMIVLINEFNPCNNIIITELFTFIHNIGKCVLQICTIKRLI